MSSTNIEQHVLDRFVWVVEPDGSAQCVLSHREYKFLLVVCGHTVADFNCKEKASAAQGALLALELRDFFKLVDADLAKWLSEHQKELNEYLKWSTARFAEYLELELQTGFGLELTEHLELRMELFQEPEAPSARSQKTDLEDGKQAVFRNKMVKAHLISKGLVSRPKREGGIQEPSL